MPALHRSGMLKSFPPTTEVNRLIMIHSTTSAAPSAGVLADLDAQDIS